jgi:2-phosphosulfolactate phosphatase
MIELFVVPAGIPDDLDRDRPVVIIDIFRASTSIMAALAAGAAEIHFAGSRAEAAVLKEKIGPGVVMAGERDGFKIDGYDLGNSPWEMTPDTVGGRPVIFNSTNGTRLLRRFTDFRQVAVGSLVALSATVAFLTRFTADPVICCAGRLGKFSLEDTLAAGMVIARLNRPEAEQDDAAVFARHMVRLAGETWRDWGENSFHGRYLTSIGMGADLDFCLTLDRFEFVPVLEGGRLVRRDMTDRLPR